MLVRLLPLLIRLNCLGQLARNSDPQARDVRALMIQDSLSYGIQIQSQIYCICDIFNITKITASNYRALAGEIQSQLYYICIIFNITKITASNYRALAGAGALAARTFSLGSVNSLNIYWRI